MKWVFVALVLANVALFAWQSRQATSRESAPVPAAQSFPSGDARHLALLTEVDRSELRPRSRPVGNPPAQPQPTPDVGEDAAAQAGSETKTTCYSVGPLADEEEIELAKEWLLGRGALTSVKRDERREVPLYWVHLPPLPTRDAALERMQDLRDAGLDDIYVIARGDMANAISLGLYSRRVSLERRLEELRRAGFDPRIAPRFRTEKAAWIDAAFADEVPDLERNFYTAFWTVDIAHVPCAAARIASDPAISYNPPEPQPGSASSDAEMDANRGDEGG